MLLRKGRVLARRLCTRSSLRIRPALGTLCFVTHSLARSACVAHERTHTDTCMRVRLGVCVRTCAAKQILQP
eukprot:436268-Alexandrium_andersonii.AAC.1